jgi:acyl-CoA hydrolase
MTSRSKHGTPRIVPFLPEGCSVDVPAQLANYVCTEFGIVNLRGLNGYERAEALISIAHPDDREALRAVAREEGVLPPKSRINFLPEEGGNRRYPAATDRHLYKLPHNSEVWGFDWDPYWNGK